MNIPNHKRLLRRVASLLMSLMFIPVLAFSHPHTFIDLKTEFIANDELLTGVKMHWIFDAPSSSAIFYELKRNQGNEAFRKQIEQDILDNIIDNHYFTDLFIDSSPVTLGKQVINSEMSEHHLNLHFTFTVPIDPPISIKNKSIEMYTYEPTYYVDMFYHNLSDIKLGNLKSQCQLTLDEPKVSDSLVTYAASLDKEDAPEEDLNLGRQFAQKVTIKCN